MNPSMPWCENMSSIIHALIISCKHKTNAFSTRTLCHTLILHHVWYGAGLKGDPNMLG